ncbi:MAG: hypothetical protein IJC67_03480 [Clostridia bacterium]|nr:hypothetical protein [Clostridia bacterium]
MFGHVLANLAELSSEENARYRAAYCGLCHTLGERHGFSARMGLSYDLVFLGLLLSSLYEPQETAGEARCVVHPAKKHAYMKNRCLEYAADMTIALTYHKCLDDWQDEKKLYKKCYSSILRSAYNKVVKEWPRQCEAIERELKVISELESADPPQPDAAANRFGRLMAELFVMEQDHWQAHLRTFGYGLGRYIYFADAAVDYDEDEKHKNYNPLRQLGIRPEEMRPMLTMLLGEASRAFEILPLVQDDHLLKNILYSGIWLKYNRGMQAREETKHDPRSA